MVVNIGSRLNTGKHCTDGIFRVACFARDIESCKFLPNRQNNLSALKNGEKGTPESKKTVGTNPGMRHAISLGTIVPPVSVIRVFRVVEG